MKDRKHYLACTIVLTEPLSLFILSIGYVVTASQDTRMALELNGRGYKRHHLHLHNSNL